VVVEPHDSYFVPIVINTAISIHSIQAVMQAIVEVCTVLLIFDSKSCSGSVAFACAPYESTFSDPCAIGFLELANAVPLCS